MPSKAGQKNIMEKLNRAQKCLISGPQNLGSRGPTWIRPWISFVGRISVHEGISLNTTLINIHEAQEVSSTAMSKPHKGVPLAKLKVACPHCHCQCR